VCDGGTADLPLFDTTTGEEVRRLSVPEGALFDPQFSPDGRLLAANGPDANPDPRSRCCRQTWFFDLRTGDLLSIGNALGPIAFAPNGKRHLGRGQPGAHRVPG
jgi:WD40 repeat protein